MQQTFRDDSLVHQKGASASFLGSSAFISPPPLPSVAFIYDDFPLNSLLLQTNKQTNRKREIFYKA